MPRNFSRTFERTFDESSREQRTKFAHLESKTFGQYCTKLLSFYNRLESLVKQLHLISKNIKIKSSCSVYFAVKVNKRAPQSKNPAELFQLAFTLLLSCNQMYAINGPKVFFHSV